MSDIVGKDIVERLRRYAIDDDDLGCGLMIEAAAEIEALRKELDRWVPAVVDWSATGAEAFHRRQATIGLPK